jgi:two-component system sensor histidine kinase QseC
MKSIRSYLIYTLGIGVGLAICISITLSYKIITHETEEIYDAELAQISRVLEGVLSIEFEDSGVQLTDTARKQSKLIIPPDIIADGEYNSRGHKYEKKLAFQVWSRKGVPFISSNADDKMLSFSDEAGYNYETIKGRQWRSFVLYSDTLSVWIKVAQLVEIREEVAHEIASVNAATLILLLPIILILITLIVRRGLGPLNQINQAISLRGNNNLTPLNFSKVPNDLKKVVGSVNRLMFTLDQALERQKRFTGNAAHELRTPLAAIKVHAQNMYPDNERLRHIQRHIVSGIDKLTHLFNQLIALSQAEAYRDVEKEELILLQSLVGELISESLPAINGKKISIKLFIDDKLCVQGNTDTLSILLRNLIDNAVKYVCDEGKIEIKATSIENYVTISIADNGSGLTNDQKKHVFERFYRASSQDTFGCGIGLSIVKEICDGSCYNITLSDSLNTSTGLTVTLTGLRC